MEKILYIVENENVVVGTTYDKSVAEQMLEDWNEYNPIALITAMRVKVNE